MTEDQDAVEWLEGCRQQLAFRSHNAMHKAVAQETELNYEAVHKALTRPKAGQRIQLRISEVLHDWLAKAANGERPAPVAATISAAPTGEVRKTLDQICATYPNRKLFYHEVAPALGVSASALKDFCCHAGEKRSFTRQGLRSLKALLKKRKKRSMRISYLAGSGTRKLANRLTESTNAVLKAIEHDPDNVSLKQAYRSKRLQLIMAVKQRWTETDWREANPSDEEETVTLFGEDGDYGF